MDIERDDEGFPIITDDTIGTTYTDEFEVTYICEYIEGLDAYGWRMIGRSGQ